MTADGVILLFGSVIGTSVTVGMFVWAKTRDHLVKIADENTASALKDRDAWKIKYETSREEIHRLNNSWNTDRLELERLRTETNFAPVGQKIDMLFESQTQSTKALMDNLQLFQAAFQEQAHAIRIMMEKLVPALTDDQVRNQEEKL